MKGQGFSLFDILAYKLKAFCFDCIYTVNSTCRTLYLLRFVYLSSSPFPFPYIIPATLIITSCSLDLKPYVSIFSSEELLAVLGMSHENVKVVLIGTQYVETDPVSFKSVVQRLTGKDCCVSWIEESSFSGIKTETKVHGKVAAERPCGTATVGVGTGGVPLLTKGFSFKDLDRMIMEAPPMDEFKWLWDD
ncbi:hypothetical protein ES288_A05G157900v1 [Gossypium darwinii]|uniref:VQ domain-containing protein n=1 Tax=Gossypium darwinii TaxID=34276 RepID=A0A5D2GFW6_GOSDA|nr:hypothetical protein ES288_A05G157900v1 [Gossypium darwinii]